MSQSVSIVCPTVNERRLFENQFERVVGVRSGKVWRKGGEVHCQSPDASWWLRLSEATELPLVVEEYKSWESVGPKLHAALEFASILRLPFSTCAYEVVREILKLASLAAHSNGATFWVDSDYGWFFSSDEFLDRIREDPAWDWRFDPEIE